MSQAHVSIPTLIVTGAVGAGKTTIGGAVSDQLTDANRPHALIDMDALRSCYPRPADDPFNTAVGYRNLAALWANYQGVGSERVIIVDVVETPEQRADYAAAIPGAAIQIVRLTASVAELQRRLAGRERGDSLRWHQARAAELTAIMDARGIGDHVIDTDGKTIDEIAAEVLQRVGWPL